MRESEKDLEEVIYGERGIERVRERSGSTLRQGWRDRIRVW